jgi:hypothetical protein
MFSLLGHRSSLWIEIHKENSHNPSRGRSKGLWVANTKISAESNDLTCTSKHGKARDIKIFDTHPKTGLRESCCFNSNPIYLHIMHVDMFVYKQRDFVTDERGSKIELFDSYVILVFVIPALGSRGGLWPVLLINIP